MFSMMRCVAMLALSTSFLSAQDSITKSQADEILMELRTIRKLLQDQTRPAAGAPPQQPTTLSMELKDAQVLGDPKAPLTMVSFTDFQCPFCQRFHLGTFPLLKRDFIDTGKLKFVLRDMPLTQIHPNAAAAAQGAHCAGDAGKYWEMVDRLYRAGSALAPESLIGYAGDVGIDVGAFRSCIESDKHKSAIDRDGSESMALGIRATPTFLVGRSTATGVDGELVSGALPYEIFSVKLKALLEAPGGADGAR